VLLWGWGVMNSTAIKEAQATGYPREKMYGIWWAGAEPDVKDVGAGAKGYNALAMQHGAEPNSKVVKDILEMVHDKGQGTGPKDEVGSGAVHARPDLGDAGRRRRAPGAGALRQGQGDDRRAGALGPGEPQPRPGKLDGMGFAGVMRPVQTSCTDHMGSSWARVHTWDGSKWAFSSDWYQADDKVLRPMVLEAASKYATEKKIVQRRTAEQCAQ
jgi:branched-chain amino acid transport system substrate-binding protein